MCRNATVTFLWLSGIYTPHFVPSSVHMPPCVQFSSVAQSCPTLCDPMDCSTPSLPVHHQFPEFTQTHVHWVGDAIQPCHPIFPSIRVFSNESVLCIKVLVAKILEFQLQHQSFQWTSRTDLLEASFLLTLIEDLSVLSFSSLLLPSSFFSGLCVFSYSVMSDSLQAHGL